MKKGIYSWAVFTGVMLGLFSPVGPKLIPYVQQIFIPTAYAVGQCSTPDDLCITTDANPVTITWKGANVGSGYPTSTQCITDADPPTNGPCLSMELFPDNVGYHDGMIYGNGSEDCLDVNAVNDGIVKQYSIPAGTYYDAIAVFYANADCTNPPGVTAGTPHTIGYANDAWNVAGYITDVSAFTLGAPSVPGGSSTTSFITLPSLGSMFASLSMTATNFFAFSQWEGFMTTFYVAGAIIVGLFVVEWLAGKVRGGLHT